MAFEKLGVFYLGRPYDIAKKAPLEGMVLYNSKDLVTHAVCIGMTGSGKTGLCVCLLEEAAMDNIPAIVIDPKGDITNLLLTFPELRPSDFAPWVNEDDAARKGLSLQDYAKQQAEQWSTGLKSWGEDGARIRKLREAAEFAIYTPGSSAGLPISILRSFSAPSAAILEDEELLQERVATTVSSLLGLMGIEADPLQSREFILISTILVDAWRKGEDLDLVKLVQRIHSPSIRRVGALDLESFYPSKERFALATKANNLLAAPGFQLWLEGEPIDIDQLTHTEKGKPRIPIFYIAHLSDAERMFFVSLLLNEVVGWMRAQSGTTSLRALLYIDEVFGYLPPVANPPSKTPMMTLLKQARAFGLGIVLATQNPVDLDYKALSNAGTWFIGRLQTERDKARVLEALDGIAASASGQFDRGKFDRILSSLEKRRFLMHNVNLDLPVVFETRWAMSYLRGPLTRNQIKTLMDPIKAITPGAAAARKTAQAPSLSARLAQEATLERPVLPPDVRQYFLPTTGARPTEQKRPVLQPMILGAAQVHFANAKARIDFTKDMVFLTPVTNDPVPVKWDQAQEASVSISQLKTEPLEGAQYSELSPAASRSKNYDLWQRDFVGWLANTQKVELLRSPSSGEYSRAGETERDFRARLQMTSREKRDEFADALQKKYASKFDTLDDRIGRAKKALTEQQAQSRGQKFDVAASVGSALLGSFLGGRRKSVTRSLSRSMKESGDVKAAETELRRLQKQREELEKEFEEEIKEREKKTDPSREILEKIAIYTTKSDVTVRLVALTWVPA
jgi:DNA helicase HerA-like ATPase